MMRRPGRSRNTFGVFLYVLGLLAGVTVISAVPASAATYTVTSASCTGPGSITQAVADANAHPGPDVISFTPGLVVNAGMCPIASGSAGLPENDFIAKVTESVVFEGNGAILQGSEFWLDVNGDKSLSRCPKKDPRIAILAVTPGFLRVGTPGADNSAITVEVHDLDMDQLNSIAAVREQGSLSISGSRMTNIARVGNCNGGGLIEVYNGTLALIDSEIALSVTWTDETVTTGGGVILGSGRIDILRSVLQANPYSFAVRSNGDANIVSSQLIDSGGIINGGNGTMNLVNSTLHADGARSVDRIVQLGSGTTNVIASTVSVRDANCTSYTCAGEGFSALPFIPMGGTIAVRQSAVGARSPSVPRSKVIETGLAGVVTADALSWIQPVNGQDAAALRTLTGQPGLLTDAPGLSTAFFTDYVDGVTPLLGSPGTPGVLIDAVPDAGSGGVNELKSPIDNQPITLDVFGNPRVDGSDNRSIGAVQQSFAPHLTVVAVGDRSIALAWNRPQDPPGNTISGYGLRYRPVGSVAWTRIDLTADTTLGHEVTDLVSGMNYEFEVVGVAGGTDGPASNVVTATPLGPVTAPVVTAVTGVETAQLYWSPARGGRSGPDHYQVVYRLAGENPWESGPSYLTGRTTMLPGLTGGVLYEFGVFAVCGDNSQGDLGTTEATPTASPSADGVTPRFAG